MLYHVAFIFMRSCQPLSFCCISDLHRIPEILLRLHRWLFDRSLILEQVLAILEPPRAPACPCVYCRHCGSEETPRVLADCNLPECPIECWKNLRKNSGELAITVRKHVEPLCRGQALQQVAQPRGRILSHLGAQIARAERCDRVARSARRISGASGWTAGAHIARATASAGIAPQEVIRQ